MSAPKAAEFYSDVDEAPQQGDILLGAVARIVADDDYTPERWTLLDEHRHTLAPEVPGQVRVPALRVAAGRALVMVTSHDCGMDKEFNAVVDRLTQDGPGQLTVEQAMDKAEVQSDLDRTFQVSPLVAPSTVSVAGRAVDQGLLMSGRIVGYLPVPPLVINGVEVIPESVVDLQYRCTLDRLTYTSRIRCVSESTSESLRYALARLDVLRTPSLERQLSDVLGQRISKAKVHKRNPLIVQLSLEDGTVLELLHKPGSPNAGPVTRSRRSVP